MTEKAEAVQLMQDYIEKNLSDDICISDLAREVHFSPWYSARIFRELTGFSPADYIRRLRLSKSALRLRDEKVKVIDAALDGGFSSVDGYQRAFRREFGCNPKEYSKNPLPVPLFIPYGVRLKDFWKEENTEMENQNTVFIQVIDKPARKVIVKRAVTAAEYMSYCSEVGCDVWGILTSMHSLCGEPVCLWLPQSLRKPGTSEYVQGVEAAADFDGKIPDGFDIIDLPAQKYLMFQGEPFCEEDYCDAIRAVEHAMERYSPSAIGMMWDSDAPRIQLEPLGERGYIELKGVKPCAK